jgi:autophagy-related protein 5
MSLNKEDSEQLWDSVKQHDFSLFNAINHKLLNPQGVNLRHIPIKLYLPHASSDTQEEEPTPGSLRVLQALVTPALSSRKYLPLCKPTPIIDTSQAHPKRWEPH